MSRIVTSNETKAISVRENKGRQQNDRTVVKLYDHFGILQRTLGEELVGEYIMQNVLILEVLI